MAGDAVTIPQALMEDTQQRLLYKIAVAVQARIPQMNDTRHRLTSKIVRQLGGTVVLDDSWANLLAKWANLLHPTGELIPRSGDPPQRLLWKIATLLYAVNASKVTTQQQPFNDDTEQRLLWKIATMYQAQGTPAPPVPPTPPVFAFTWAPDNALCVWTDSGGGHIDTLAAFNATADFATVSSVAFQTGLLTSVTGPWNLLPSLRDCLLDLDTGLVSVAPFSQATFHAFRFNNGGAAGVSISFPNLTQMGLSLGEFIELINNLGIVSFSAPLLGVVSDHITFSNCSNLSSFNFSALTSVGNVVISGCPKLADVRLPALVSTNNLTVSGNGALAGPGVYDFSSLANVIPGDILISNNANPFSLAFPALLNVQGNFTVTGNAGLTSFSLNNPAGSSIAGSLNVSNNPSLTTAFIDPATSFTNVGTGSLSIDFSGCALNQASVDGILAKAAGDSACCGDQIFLAGGTNAAPTGGALNPDYVALINAGCVVTIN